MAQADENRLKSWSFRDAQEWVLGSREAIELSPPEAAATAPDTEEVAISLADSDDRAPGSESADPQLERMRQIEAKETTFDFIMRYSLV